MSWRRTTQVSGTARGRGAGAASRAGRPRPRPDRRSWPRELDFPRTFVARSSGVRQSWPGLDSPAHPRGRPPPRNHGTGRPGSRSSRRGSCPLATACAEPAPSSSSGQALSLPKGRASAPPVRPSCHATPCRRHLQVTESQDASYAACWSGPARDPRPCRSRRRTLARRTQLHRLH
jgi:hypothetical protein